ncbi:Npt1/Npt2 family nucleotide transporter [Criblamydia sequanensis]|uniref:ADP,ATP carrier protein n=1 Tax=Candidatus Criblamydia sequanensis CRIB-18 TaxID=1437425 RepID=A0A090E264_9BACT|nr:Npt1/Npt2 family nucleotide transporter [Criblamydia sequanensis]CDR34759.1 ADP/ATP translocase [Criblamydia sequanensis CRIB-18]
MKATETAQEFGKWRSFLWPIHNYELRKLIPLLAIFFLITFDYNVLRTMKDAVVVTAKSSGAEVIPFIKVWVMFPASILITFLFTRLSNKMKLEYVFYIMMSLFLAYYFIFTFIIYPAKDSLHPNQTADQLQAILPLGLKGFIAMYRNWTCTTFYVMSELWSNIILSMLFWGFANQVTRLGEAARFYGLFGVGANFSGVVAGYASVIICSQEYNPNLPFGKDAWEQSMMILVGLVILSGILAMLLFRWFNKQVLTDPLFAEPGMLGQDVKVRGKISMRASIRYLWNSSYLVYIALIVIAYNIVINFVEVLWKHEVHALFPDPKDYNLYMNHVSTIIGAIATFTALFISGNSIRKLGWSFTALLTPVILFISSIGFFGSFFLKEFSPATLIGMGFSPLALVVFFGSMQNILSRGAKYTVFDATREMAFVPLSAESKIKGKAVVDGLCSRLGKSGGSVIYQTLLILFSTITASAPIVSVFLFIVIAIWGGATYLLGKEFALLTGSGERGALKQPKEQTA